ncbi:MAG TPA: glycosyl hydrolase-related protein, partial [Candidatus Dormibacteraeota bacterium]|nr:glycosyl hydrolase-related protein [Candidatus Dormibacteraeota bacterium]
MDRCLVVSHFHWDREWYRTFEAYRARLADAVDRVLELLEADAGYHFLLDGQTVVIEDYLAVRPQRREELEAALRAGRLATGPWYVQPDSLLPSGEALVRNLLYGTRLAAEFGGHPSRIAYVPDSFGHPAQFPQLFAGFGLDTFVYWRGNGSEIDALGGLYRWEAPNGSAVTALLLRDGYFNAACLPDDPDQAAARLAAYLAKVDAEGGPRLLMNGFDHMLPDSHVGAVAEALQALLDAPVQRGLLDDLAVSAPADRPPFRGPLVGARLANLLPGVWSTRMPIKLANRRCEALLEGWAEPWAALSHALGALDERPALRLAWRRVLHNQAHDSLCGCSVDAVATQVMGRYDSAAGLARETVSRLLERLAGHDVERRTPDVVEHDVAVFNPSPHPRTDVVHVALDPYPGFSLRVGEPLLPRFTIAAFEEPGFAIDGQPVRIVPSLDPERTRWLPIQSPLDLEFVASDVPAFGYRRFTLTRVARPEETVDDGREIAAGAVRVRVDDDGTLAVDFGDRRFAGLLAIEDRGDGGDTYDFDAIPGDAGGALAAVSWRRRCHPSGIQRLEITRVLDVPLGVHEDREQRAEEGIALRVTTEVRVAPGVPRVDLVVRVHNTARDHRVRLRFPTGAPAADGIAATTFDVGPPTLAGADQRDWVHPPPTTFPHQGWVSANGITVVAPGLPEAEIAADGAIVITLLRAVGWLARFGLRSRMQPAGPVMPVDGAQLLGPLEARLSLFAGVDPVAARDAELGLRGIIAGDHPLLGPETSLLSLVRNGVVLSAVKPAEDGDGIVVRVLNPTDDPLDAQLTIGVPIVSVESVRLDETPDGGACARDRN